MALLSRATKSLELIISDGLKAMFGQQLETLQLRSNYPISLSLVVQLECFHSLAVQRVVGHEHLARISVHDLSLSPWLSQRDAVPGRVSGLPLLVSLERVGVHQCFVRELQHIGQGS